MPVPNIPPTSLEVPNPAMASRNASIPATIGMSPPSIGRLYLRPHVILVLVLERQVQRQPPDSTRPPNERPCRFVGKSSQYPQTSTSVPSSSHHGSSSPASPNADMALSRPSCGIRHGRVGLACRDVTHLRERGEAREARVDFTGLVQPHPVRYAKTARHRSSEVRLESVKQVRPRHVITAQHRRTARTHDRLWTYRLNLCQVLADACPAPFQPLGELPGIYVVPVSVNRLVTLRGNPLLSQTSHL